MAYDLELRVRAVEDFTARWEALVSRWTALRRRDAEGAAALLAQALGEGLADVPDGPGAGHKAPAPADELACARAVLAASGLFDEEGYTQANRTNLRHGQNALAHFVSQGWRELRAPNLDFDLWWYWAEHLDPTDSRINPFLHFAVWGRHHGHRPSPQVHPLREGQKPAPGPDSGMRRVCLFAAYDRDGLVDPYVVDYLRELSRHADIYYLADGTLEPGELDKIAEFTVAAWAVPHAAYDFGSFSMLARDLVGWDVIDGYDELLLANDSCFLVRPLDDVFDRMAESRCSWWSLQATSMEHAESYLEDDSPIPLAEAKSRFIGPRRWTDVHYLHLSSYFMVFRREVFTDPGFRWRLDTVCGQPNKFMVVHKYEVGLSRYLMDQGFDFDTFLPDLYPFHPLYSRRVFETLEQGFPLVKRNFLAENPMHVVGLETWSKRLREIVPDAAVDVMEANVLRVSPADKLHQAYRVEVSPLGVPRGLERPLGRGYRLRTLDRETPEHGHWWAFPVSATTHVMEPGARAVFEQVRHDPSIHKVVLTRSRHLDVAGEWVTSVSIDTLESQEHLVRCGVIVVGDEPGRALTAAPTQRRHRFVHPGIGLPLGPAGMDTGPDTTWEWLSGLVVSSEAEAVVRAAAHPALPIDRMWCHGLPRHDLLVMSSDTLAPDTRVEEERLAERLDGRRLLVLWLDHRLPAPKAKALASGLGEWCRRHDIVLGLRERRVDSRDSLSYTMLGQGAVGLSDRHLRNPMVIHRLAWAVVTDGAPLALDALVAGLPVVQLGHEPDGAEAVLPRDFWPQALHAARIQDLGATLDTLLTRTDPWPELRGLARTDGHNSWRVVQHLRRLSLT